MTRRLKAALARMDLNPIGDVLGAAILFACLIVGTWWVDALQVVVK